MAMRRRGDGLVGNRQGHANDLLCVLFLAHSDGSHYATVDLVNILGRYREWVRVLQGTTGQGRDIAGGYLDEHHQVKTVDRQTVWLAGAVVRQYHFTFTNREPLTISYFL